MNAPLNPVECRAEDCGRPAHALGLCTKHYQRWNKNRRLDAPSPADRFFDKVDLFGASGCWNWLGHLNAYGYGQFGEDKKLHLAHRWAWTHLKGEIPEETPHLDHTCRNRRCVNPDHLEPVTQAENNRRARPHRDYPQPLAVCRRGHEMDEANRYPRKDRPGKFACRKCQVIGQQAYAARKKAQA